MTQCTHSSDWWKNMERCVACDAPYSDEEAEMIANQAPREFSNEQLAIIDRMRAEQEVQS